MTREELLDELAKTLDSVRSQMTWDDLLAVTMLLHEHTKLHWTAATVKHINEATGGGDDQG